MSRSTFNTQNVALSVVAAAVVFGAVTVSQQAYKASLVESPNIVPGGFMNTTPETGVHVNADLRTTDPKACGDTSPTCDGACPTGQICVGAPDDGTKKSGCECIVPEQPEPPKEPKKPVVVECGDSKPMCNGTCPVGEVCFGTGKATGMPSAWCECKPEVKD